MKDYCKNCACKISPADEICPDCGARLTPQKILCKTCGQEISKDSKFCSSCGSLVVHNTSELCPSFGSQITGGEKFCKECGFNLNSSSHTNTSKNHNKLALGIIGIIVIILIVGAFIALSVEIVEPQKVEVGSTEFMIPGDYELDPSSSDADYEYSNMMFSKSWTNLDGDEIYIGTMSVPYGVDSQEMIAANGGVLMNLMGYDGYYVEDDPSYFFSFESDGSVCIVGVSNPDTFDEIICL